MYIIVSIFSFDSGLTVTNFGVPQRSSLGPLLFLLYIHDLHQAIKFFRKVHHFADDTNLLKLCGKRIYPTETVKYLCVKIDTNLKWEYHVNDLSTKLDRANALLFKIRKYVSLKILRSIYFPIFDSYLSFCFLIWAQNCSTIQQIVILQKKLLELLIFNQGFSIPVSY